RLECDARRRPHPWDPRARLPADDRSVRVRRGRLSSANLNSRHPLRVDRRGARTAARVGRQRCRAGLVRARRVSRHRDLLRREPGYWTGAMIASYSLGVPVLVALFVALWLLTRWDVAVALVIADLAFIAAAPFVWRYSRVIWLHLDWIVDPVRG